MIPLPTKASASACPVLPCGCCGCGCVPDDTPAPPHEPEIPPSRPRDPGKCCCTDRSTLVQLEFVDFDLDLGSSIWVFADPVVPAVPTLPPDIRLSVPIPACPLHVLDCVWLC